MPINAYTGLMGSGKSFECVRSVIVPAIKSGRRVVTNVDGIDSDAIRAYCVENFGTQLADLGSVVHCKNDDVHSPNFFPFGSDAETFCQPGDIICIDEAWRFWGTDCKLLAEHKIFFREHRHFVHPVSKVSSDLVLMVQDITDLHRVLRVVVELNFRTTKIKSLGLNKVYRVEMWEGYKQTIKGRVSVSNKKYDPAIFPLYSSYSGGSGKELQVDSRQNILRNKSLWFFLIGILVLGSSSFYFAWRFFNPPQLEPINPDSSQIESLPSLPTSSLPTASVTTGNDSPWYIAGLMTAAGSTYVVLSSQDGRLRLEHPSNFQNVGTLMTGLVDGKQVSAWIGTSTTAGQPQ